MNRFSVEATFYADRYIAPKIYHYRMDLGIRNDGRVYLEREKLERKIGHNSQAPYLLVYEAREGSLFRFDKGEIFEFCKEKTKNLLGQRSFATFVNV